MVVSTAGTQYLYRADAGLVIRPIRRIPAFRV
jgi:hypothetical protein